MQLEHTRTLYHRNFAYWKNDEIIGRHLREYGEYQQKEINLLAGLLDRIDAKQKVVWDIGANIGVHTMAFSKHCAFVCSWEANPQNYKLLRLNTQGKLAPNVKVHNVAISNGEKDKLLIQDFDDSITDNKGELAIVESGGVEVQARTLDSYLMNYPLPTLVKIDVEGHELEVLQGARAMLQTVKPILYIETQSNDSYSKHIKFLQDNDYRMWWFACPNYNRDNVKKNKDNFCGNTVICSMLAFHKDVNGLNNIELQEVKSVDDHWTYFDWDYDTGLTRAKKND